MKKFKKLAAVILSVAMLVTMIPTTAFAASNLTGTFDEGTIVKSSDGGTYQFSKAEAGVISIYYYDTASRSVKVFNGQLDSTDPKRTYTITTDSGTYRGYCVEHGVHTDGSKNMKTLKNEEVDQIIYAGLSNQAKLNLELALLYGYQFGDSISRLTTSVADGGLGFNDSKYYGKNSTTGYSWGDWYIATQCIIWEIQQRNRTDSMERVTNGLGVSGNHYLSIVSGRPAVDIYNWMVSSIKGHFKFPSTVSGRDDKNPKEIKLAEEHKTSDGYEYTFKDSTGLGLDYVVLSKSGKKLNNNRVSITFNEATKEYTLHVKGEPGDDVFMIKHAFDGQEVEDDLLYWCWYSNGSHVQAIATGAADPVEKFFTFKASVADTPDEPPAEGNPQPEPEYVPNFEIPIEKIDYNPGWDGDTHTGMGDASLGATYNLYRSIDGGAEELIDSITLDEWGTQQSFYDTPWDLEYIKESKAESGSMNHEETDDEGNVTHSCTVEPLKAEWNASVTYRIEEIRPDGRFIEPDTGERTYSASYYAVTDNSQACADDPENWSDITYTVTWDDGTTTGTVDSVETDLVYALETFVNDEYRGRIFLSKSNETGDVFNEEGSSGSQEKSKNSKWKVKLQSGGWENHPYISFVDEGLDRSGTQIYRVVRDTSGTDNATTDLTVGTNGCIYIYDIPYGTYLVEEVAADDTSYVLESFIQFVGEHNNGYYPDDEEKDNRYDWNLRDKKKENVIKVVKTDAETGKPVSAEDLKNAKFYIRYMGSPLSADPTKDDNYGRLLPNAADINSTSKDYTFTAGDNGEIVIPYDLEFGIYRIEEWLLPEGYFVGEYAEDGSAKNHSYDELSEGQTKVLAAGDMYDSLVTIYDSNGEKVEYKGGSEYKLNEIFNYYTFEVTKQDGHLEGTEYTKYYQAVAMPNNQVKGRIEITKEGEVLTGFKEEKISGLTVMTPVYETVQNVKDAVYGIYAAIDEWLSDGNEGPTIHDAATDDEIVIPTTKSTHAGNLFETVKGMLSDFFTGTGDVYETGEMEHSSGAKLWFLKDRDAAEDGEYTRIYLTPEQKPTSYSYAYETSENGMDYRYDVNVLMEYKAGGKNVTDVNITKTTSVGNGYLPSLDEFITLPTAAVGDSAVSSMENYESAFGNILDSFNENDLYHADGQEVYDVNTGLLLKDLGNIGAERYTAIDYDLYTLNADDMKVTTVTITPGADNNNDGDYDDPGVDSNGDGDYDDLGVDDGDGVYDKEGESAPDVMPDVAPVTAERTAFEASNFDTDLTTTLVNPAEGMAAVKKMWNDVNADTIEDEGEVTYAVYVKGYWQDAQYTEFLAWMPCDEYGNITPEYTILDGWSEVPFEGNPAEEPHYIIISQEQVILDDQDQQIGSETVYKVLLSDKVTWQDCQPNGDFEKLYVQHYDVTYTQEAGNEEGFLISWDGIEITAAAKLDNTATTTITNPFSVTPAIDLGIGYTQETEEKTTTFTAAEPSAPIYFMSRDGVKTEMYYFGGLTKTILTIPMDAVEGNFEYCVPMITYGKGEDAQIINWFNELTPDKSVFEKELLAYNTIRAERIEGADGEDVTYVITIISDQKMATEGDGVVAGERPFSITYSDGYTASIYCGKSADGNGLGVMELDSVYRTNRYSTSDLIETLTTGEDGTATSGLLPLGKYIIRELSAPEGFVTDDTTYEVELSYKDQFTPIIWKLKNFMNRAVSVEVELQKVFETAYESGEYVPAGGAVFGLYSGEKLSAAENSANYESTIGADTLIDVIKVGESGVVRSNVKLPEGTYYLKELSTRSGYVLNETPFYFTVTDKVQAESSEFAYAADGINGNLYMDRYGKVIVNIDTETRFPSATLSVDGVTYDLGVSFEENGVLNEVTSAYSNVEVTVNDGQTREITLTNGKSLTVKVAGNTYTYTIDGVEKEVIPTVSETAYYAAYEAAFKPVEGESLTTVTDKVDVTFAGEQTPFVTAEIIHTPVTKEVIVTPAVPGVDENEDGDYDDEGEKAPVQAVTKTVGVLDKDGYQTYTHEAKLQKYGAGAEDAFFTVEADGFLQVMFEVGKPPVKAELSKDGQFIISTSDVVDGSMDDTETPKVRLNYQDVTKDILFTKSVTFARQDREAETVQIKVNTLDNVNAAPVENNLEPPKPDKPTTPDTPDIPYVPTPDTPSIRTSAVDGDTNDHISLADKSVTIVDTVNYYELTVGKEYVVKGILMDQKTGEALLVDGKNITAEAKFKPTTENGSVDVTFVFDGSELAGKTTVVFEELYLLTDIDGDGKPDKEDPVAEHKDIDDEKQTVYIPEIGTTAVNGEDGEKEALADKFVTVVDTVSYDNLIAGREYIMKGTLMVKETGKALKVDGKKVTSEITFTPETADGTIEMEFTFDGSKLGGKSVVVFEELFIRVDTNDDGKTDSKEPVAEHKDINDEGQTVKLKKTVVSIGTTAVDGETGSKTAKADKSVTIIDTVSYENLIPGYKYVLKGTLMVKETGEALRVDGKKITAEKKFVPSKEDGTVDMEFTFDGSKLDGKSVVVFEELYLRVDTDNDGKPDDRELVAKHKDINDKGQTVKLKKKIGTVELQTPNGEDENGEVSVVPETGDTSYQIILFHLTVMLVSLVMLAALLIYRRREHREK